MHRWIINWMIGDEEFQVEGEDNVDGGCCQTGAK
jgi:hypothetical protein